MPIHKKKKKYYYVVIVEFLLSIIDYDIVFVIQIFVMLLSNIFCNVSILDKNVSILYENIKYRSRC